MVHQCRTSAESVSLQGIGEPGHAALYAAAHRHIVDQAVVKVVVNTVAAVVTVLEDLLAVSDLHNIHSACVLHLTYFLLVKEGVHSRSVVADAEEAFVAYHSPYLANVMPSCVFGLEKA